MLFRSVFYVLLKDLLEVLGVAAGFGESAGGEQGWKKKKCCKKGQGSGFECAGHCKGPLSRGVELQGACRAGGRRKCGERSGSEGMCREIGGEGDGGTAFEA